jgi:hypothetical protein
MAARVASIRHTSQASDGIDAIYGNSIGSIVAETPHTNTITMTGNSTANGVLIGLLSSFGSAIFIALIFIIVYFFKYTSGGRILLDRIGRPGDYDDEQSFLREEAEALEQMEEGPRIEYLRAKGSY